MRKALLGCLLCLLLCGCAAAQTPAETAVSAMPTAAVTPTVSPAPAPTPIMIAGSTVENGTLCAVLEAEDFAALDAIEDLKVLDVSGSTCYDAILAYRDAHPNVTVRYTVPFGDEAIPGDAEAATVAQLSDPGLLCYLPDLSALTVTEPLSVETAQALSDALPNAALHYCVAFAGRTADSDATALDLSDADPSDAEAIAKALAVLPKVEEINLDHADGTTDWTLPAAKLLLTIEITTLELLAHSPKL